MERTMQSTWRFCMNKESLQRYTNPFALAVITVCFAFLFGFVPTAYADTEAGDTVGDANAAEAQENGTGADAADDAVSTEENRAVQESEPQGESSGGAGGSDSETVQQPASENGEQNDATVVDTGASEECGPQGSSEAPTASGEDGAAAETTSPDATTDLDEVVTTAEPARETSGDAEQEVADENDAATKEAEEPKSDSAIVEPPASGTITVSKAANASKSVASVKKAGSLTTALKSSWYSIKTLLNSAYNFQAKGSSSKNGTRIVLARVNATNGQAFKIVKRGNYYQILAGTGNNARIVVSSNGSVKLGASDGNNSLFKLYSYPNGLYRLVNVGTGLALSVKNGNVKSGIDIVAVKPSAGNKALSLKIVARKGLLNPGVYSIRTVLGDKKGISPKSSSLKQGASASLARYYGMLTQKWNVKPVEGKTNVYIIESIATGYRLTASADKPAVLKKATNASNQYWVPYGLDGKVVFKSYAMGRYLQVKDSKTAIGTPIVCGKKTASSKRLFTATKVNHVDSGVFEFDSFTNAKLAIGVPGASEASNVAIKLGTDGNKLEQRWYYNASSKTLTSINSGLVLTVKGGKAASGATLVQSKYANTAAQKWKFTYLGDGKFKISSVANSAIVVNAGGKKSGSAVKLAKSGNSSSQNWKLVQVPQNSTSYMKLGFSLDQMARWQKAGNPYLSSYTISYLKSMLNPSNRNRYEFLDLRNRTGVSASVLNAFINTSGSNGKLKGLGSAFIAAAKTYGINETYLLAHAILESGWGTSKLASGYKYSGGYIDGKYYPKGTYYNFFGIGAYDSSPLSGGRKLAIINGWNTPSKAVKGAGKWIAGNYIHATNFSSYDRYPQPTLYMMKWDVSRTKAIKGYGYHQYATSTTWSESIAKLMGQIYSRTDQKMALKFIKPKYS